MWVPRVGTLHCRHAFDGDVVLDEGRHAVEIAAIWPPRISPGPRAVERFEREAVQFRVDGLGARNRGLDELARRHLTGSELLDETDGIKIAKGVIAEGMNAFHDQTV